MCRLLHNAFLFLLAVLPTGVWAQGGIDFHPIEGQTYVIMNAETGEFLFRRAASYFAGSYCPALTDDASNSSLTISNVIKDALWGIQPTGNNDFSYYIYNKSFSSNSATTSTRYYFEDKQEGTSHFYKLTATSSTNSDKWYFLRSPFNREGYKVSTQPNFRKNLWYLTYSSSLNYKGLWLYDSQDDAITLTGASDISDTKPGYDLSSFHFLTYDDLWKTYTNIKNNGEAGGRLAGSSTTLASYSYVAIDQRTPQDFLNLITAIRTFAKAKRFQPLYGDKTGADRHALMSAAFSKTYYVIKSRRFNTYLARKRKGDLYLSKSINSDCVWSLISAVDKDKNDRYALLSLTNQDNPTAPYLTIGGTDSIHSYINIAAASDCDPKFCSLVSYDDTKKLISFYPGTVDKPKTNNGYGQYEEDVTPSSTTTTFVNSVADWVTCSDWKIVSYDVSSNEHVALSDEQLKIMADPSKSPQPFFRIENVAFSIEDWGAGWLADVDHRAELMSNHFLATSLDDNTKPLINTYNSNNEMPLIDIVSTTESKAWAPNLWRIELVRKGTGNGVDMPVGVVTATPHNLYKIKNANSGKYICWPVGYLSSETNYATKYFTLKKDAKNTEIAYFWLEDLGNGQYALALRDPNKNTNLNYSDGKAAGYAIINSDYTLNLYNSSNTLKSNYDIGRYTAGLYFSSSKPAADSNGAFSFEPATTVEAFTGDDDDRENGNPQYRYVTAYYPFDVKLVTNDETDDKTGIFSAYWTDSKEQKVSFSKLDYLPANTGGIVFYPYNNAESEVVTYQLNPEVSSKQTVSSILDGVCESEDLWFANTKDAVSKQYPTSKDDTRYNFLVFSSWEYTSSTANNGTTLGLFHPLDACPMTNRCYIDLKKDANKTAYNYLNTTSPDPAKGSLIAFSFDDVPAGIARIPAYVQSNDAWYDLQGRKTWFPTSGIYIHNGKKIFIK